MVAFFTLEKAIYEVSYELANRPAWVDIPLQGVLNILATDGRGRACCGGLIRRSRRSSRRGMATRSPFSACTRRRAGYPSGRCCRTRRTMAVVEPATGKIAGQGRPAPSGRIFCRHYRRPQGAVPLSPEGLERRRCSTSFTTSILFRRSSANSTSICSPRAIISRATASSERTRWCTKVSRASPLRYGRRTPAGSVSSAISTTGTAGGCRCAISAGSGSSSCRACAPAISTNTRSSALMGSFCR